MLNKVLRLLLGCKEGESITNNIKKKKVKVERLFFRKHYSQKDIKDAFNALGLSQGDNLIVHCAWREFFNYDSTPNSLIDAIIENVGPNGNIAMPSYGSDDTVFDVASTPSAAGVLSEVFRNNYPVERSNCSHFSMAVMGPDAKVVTAEQIDSVTGFDEKGAYAKMLELSNTKVLFLGLGKYPLQITQMHIEEYANRNKYPWCGDLFKDWYSATLLNTPERGKSLKRQMLKRKSGRPNKRNRKLIYKQLENYQHKRIGNIDLVITNSNDARKSIESCLKAKMQFSK